MNPQSLFRPDPDCPSRGKQNEGNLTVHDGLKDRFRGSTCQTTFSSRKGTLFNRLKTDPQTVVCVLVLLSFGCPVRAVVEAFCLDERTVRSWQIKAGRQCEQVHTRLVTDKPGQMPQVQADEMRLRCQKRVVWRAMALCVSTRLWLGGVVSSQRDKHLARPVRCSPMASRRTKPPTPAPFAGQSRRAERDALHLKPVPVSYWLLR